MLLFCFCCYYCCCCCCCFCAVTVRSDDFFKFVTLRCVRRRELYYWNLFIIYFSRVTNTAEFILSNSRYEFMLICNHVNLSFVISRAITVINFEPNYVGIYKIFISVKMLFVEETYVTAHTSPLNFAFRAKNLKNNTAKKSNTFGKLINCRK